MTGVQTCALPIFLAQGEDYCIVEPLTPEDANDKVKKKALRPGDQVILAAKEIWDGMILE